MRKLKIKIILIISEINLKTLIEKNKKIENFEKIISNDHTFLEEQLAENSP